MASPKKLAKVDLLTGSLDAICEWYCNLLEAHVEFRSDFDEFLTGYGDSGGENSGGAPVMWAGGDFDYDGAVDADDFQLFFRGLVNQGRPSYTPQLYEALSAFVAAQGISADLAAVPEPTVAGVAAIAAIAVASSRVRRRRRFDR